MATFVLVPGFWLGGWAFARVTAALRASGHEVHPVTLTGLGDRAHLASPEVDLETHARDVINTIEYAGLDEVILVGHSGGGLPVSLAADRIPGRLARVVYLESAALPDGMRQFDANPPEARERIEKQIAAEGEGWRIPVPAYDTADPIVEGVGEDDLALIRSRGVPQPYLTAMQPLRRTRRGPVPETLFACMFPLDEVRRMLAERHPMFAGFGDDLQVVGLPTGHYPMLSRPAETAAILGGLA
jgi:pimeloyl-ACP methyl ester carboxylesterase